MKRNREKRGQRAAKRQPDPEAKEKRRIQARIRSGELVPMDRKKITSSSVMPLLTIPHPDGCYADYTFKCKDCGAVETWTARQQKWWHEIAGGEIERIAVRCRACRIRERQRSGEARRVHMEGIEAKRRRIAEAERAARSGKRP